MRHARLRVGVQHRKIELVFRRVQIDEEVVNLIQHRRRPRVRSIDFIQHDNRRQLRRQRLLQHVTRLRQRPFARVHQQQHSVHHAQRAFHFSAEIAVPRRVHDIDFRVVIRHCGVFRQNRDSALALQVVRVHHAFHQMSVRAENSALPQHGVHQRRLAVVHVRDNGDVA